MRKIGNPNGRRLIKIWSLLAFLVAITVSSLIFVYRQYGLRTLKSGDVELPSLTLPLRFTVLSRSDTSISGRFHFYNALGREISSFERSWNGSELYIESLGISLGKRFFVFPSRVFTDSATAKKGTSLFPYYDQDGFPAVFDSPSLSPQTRQALATLFSRVMLSDSLFGRNPTVRAAPMKNSPFFSLFGRIQREVQRSRDLEIGVAYSFRAYADGTIEVEKE
jgi:hypothetical protein